MHAFTFGRELLLIVVWLCGCVVTG